MEHAKQLEGGREPIKTIQHKYTLRPDPRPHPRIDDDGWAFKDPEAGSVGPSRYEESTAVKVMETQKMKAENRLRMERFRQDLESDISGNLHKGLQAMSIEDPKKKEGPTRSGKDDGQREPDAEGSSSDDTDEESVGSGDSTEMREKWLKAVYAGACDD